MDKLFLTDFVVWAYRTEDNVYWQCTVRPKGNRCRATVIEHNGHYRQGVHGHMHAAASDALRNAKVSRLRYM